MDRTTTFSRLRAILAPAIRPVLTWVPPVRWLAMRWLATRQPSVATVDGLEFEVHPADFGVTFEIAQTGDYEPATRRVCMDALRSGDVFIDIGAHVGLFTVPASSQVGDAGRVVAFEPDSDNRQLLERNVERHGCGNVDVVAAAVSDHAGTMVLRKSRFNTGDHRIAAEGVGERVEVVTLDAWCASAGVQPRVVKMDVQGAEPQVIAGMHRLLDGAFPLDLFLEFTPSLLRKAGVDPASLMRSLESSGFSLRIIDERDGTDREIDVDGLMRACPARGYVNVQATRGHA